MAANLLVKRSTARLLRLLRFQVAAFTTESPLPSEPFCTDGIVTPVRHPDASDPLSFMSADTAYYRLKQYCKKYNLLKDSRSIDEILDDDKEWQSFFHLTDRDTASTYLWCHWKMLVHFGLSTLYMLFKEHLVKHCNHRKVQMDEALKFKEAFSLRSIDKLAVEAEGYYNETVRYRNRKRLPKLKIGFGTNIPDEIMAEIEEDIVKEMNQKIKVEGDPTMVRSQ